MGGGDFAHTAHVNKIRKELTSTTGTASSRYRGISTAPFRGGRVRAAVGSAATLRAVRAATFQDNTIRATVRGTAAIGGRGITATATFLLRLTLTAATAGGFRLTALDAQHIFRQIQPTRKLGVSGVASSNHDDVLHRHHWQFFGAELLQILRHGLALDELRRGAGQIEPLYFDAVLF